MRRYLSIPMALAASLFLMNATPALADPFCCECKDGKKHLLEESNIAVATTKCSVKCRRAVVPQKGVCEAPPAAPSAAAPSAATPAAGGASAGKASVSLFKSEDCSGDATRTEKSEAQLGDGYRSYQVDSGIASAYAKANFGGAGTQPVAGSLCVSPGWSIGSVKIGK